jgi:hypothetical protein
MGGPPWLFLMANLVYFYLLSCTLIRAVAAALSDSTDPECSAQPWTVVRFELRSWIYRDGNPSQGASRVASIPDHDDPCSTGLLSLCPCPWLGQPRRESHTVSARADSHAKLAPSLVSMGSSKCLRRLPLAVLPTRHRSASPSALSIRSCTCPSTSQEAKRLFVHIASFLPGPETIGELAPVFALLEPELTVDLRSYPYFRSMRAAATGRA